MFFRNVSIQEYIDCEITYSITDEQSTMGFYIIYSRIKYDFLKLVPGSNFGKRGGRGNSLLKMFSEWVSHWPLNFSAVFN